MGNTKSKKMQKEPDRFFEREKWKEQKREEKKKKNVNPSHKRVGVKEPPLNPAVGLTPPPMGPGPAPAPAHVRSYDDEALDRMRYQLNNDSDAFLLNNILLSVQFFENYEREIQCLKNNPVSERQHFMDEAMVNHHKHVFCADRIHECVQEHVLYQKQKDHVEPILSPRLFIIYDNVEASEPGDTSDYSAVLDAPFYKLRIEDCKEPGYVKLKQLEVLESTLQKEENVIVRHNSEDSLYTDSEKESNASDSVTYKKERRIVNEEANGKLTLQENSHIIDKTKDSQLDLYKYQTEKKRTSISFQNQSALPKLGIKVNGKIDDKDAASDEYESRPRKSILKNARRFSGPIRDSNIKTNATTPHNVSLEYLASEDTETSGYRSNASSRRTESSETESDYGYSTITEATTPKKVTLSLHPNLAASSVLPDECWESINVKSIDWSDDDDEENDTASKQSINRNLFETQHYLSSSIFMSSFVDNFILNLGSGLGLSQDTIGNAMTQGASVYCDFIRNGSKVSNEVFPALLAAWPNAANQWIIRERRIIQNPRTNFSYQWPTKYMVSKTIGFGCFLVPVGYRPKRGINPDQSLQWKIIFPAAERYLESCLAHSHMRCYLFSLVLHKTFMENETSKIGIDATHIKNHLLWQCEDNYARWPEDRLGEALRLFLRNFYIHFGQCRFPNYFIENCNEFNCIPKPILLRFQRKLADILEAPVMHILHAINKLKYTRKDFYPTFNSWKLYQILTCRNPLRLLNPNIPMVVPTYNNESSDSDDNINNIWDKAKAHDKHYQWKKERQRQIKERRKASSSVKKQRTSVKGDIEINKTIILPSKMEAERRRLVLEFFIPHFIAMARSSEKFEALRQAVIYLEQAQRLCILLKEEPAGDMSARDYIDIIRDKLADCQRKLVNEGGYKLQNREKKHTDVNIQTKAFRKHRPRYEHIINQDSPTDSGGIAPFTFVDIHNDQPASHDFKKLLEESKL